MSSDFTYFVNVGRMWGWERAASGFPCYCESEDDQIKAMDLVCLNGFALESLINFFVMEVVFCREAWF